MIVGEEGCESEDRGGMWMVVPRPEWIRVRRDHFVLLDFVFELRI